MAKILRMTDRIKFSVKDIEFVVAPLSIMQKSEISGANKNFGGESQIDLVKSQFLYIKYGLKEMNGVTDHDGNEYKLQFDDGCLTDSCVDEIFNMEQKEDFLNIAWQFFNGLPEKLIDPATGKTLKGVKLEVLGKGGADS